MKRDGKGEGDRGGSRGNLVVGKGRRKRGMRRERGKEVIRMGLGKEEGEI